MSTRQETHASTPESAIRESATRLDTDQLERVHGGTLRTDEEARGAS